MRALLNAIYVCKKDLIPPLDYTKTIELLKDEIPFEVYKTIKEIIEIKSCGLEKDIVKKIPVLDEFVESNMNKTYEVPRRTPDLKLLNDFLTSEILLSKKIKNSRGGEYIF